MNTPDLHSVVSALLLIR